MDMESCLKSHKCIVWKDTDYLGYVFHTGKSIPVASGIVPALLVGLYSINGKSLMVYPLDSYDKVNELYMPVIDFFNTINDSGGIAFIAKDPSDIDWHFQIEARKDHLYLDKDTRKLLERRFVRKITEMQDRKTITSCESDTYLELLQCTFAHKDYEILRAYTEMKHICFFHRNTGRDFCLACAYFTYIKHHRQIIMELWDGMNGR